MVGGFFHCDDLLSERLIELEEGGFKKCRGVRGKWRRAAWTA